MSENRLARVRWQMGQVLRPEHFRALEDTMLGQSRMGLELDGLPRVGVARLAWQEALLHHEGLLTLRELVVVMPSGRLLVLGENAELDSPSFDLNECEGSRVPIYLHVLVGETPMTPPAADGEVPVVRVLYQLSLSRDDVVNGSIEHMQLVLLGRVEEDHWQLVDEYIPPLLSTWGTPVLRSMLEGLSDPLERLRVKLSRQLSINYLDGTDQTGTRSLLREILAFQALLGDFNEGVDLHPFLTYRQLRQLLFEVFFYQGANQRVSPELITEPYNHASLGDCFGRVVTAIREVSSQEWGGARFVSFVRSGDIFLVDLPTDLTEDEEVFFVIRRPRIWIELEISRFKLASRSRLDRLHRLSLKGVGLTPAPLPAFSRQLSPELEIYRIEKDNEWKKAYTEGGLAFYAREGQDSLDAAICWSASAAGAPWR